MVKFLLNQVGRHATHAVAAKHLQGSRLNMKLGFSLLRDRRIPVWPKLFALAIGGAIAALLITLEISPEAALAFLMPLFGLALDFLVDGLEVMVLPFLFAALALPFIAPRDLVDQIMMERAAGAVPALPPTATS